MYYFLWISKGEKQGILVKAKDEEAAIAVIKRQFSKVPKKPTLHPVDCISEIFDFDEHGIAIKSKVFLEG